MDFMQRGSHQGQAAGASHTSESGSGGHGKGKKRGISWLRLTSVVLLFSATILAIALLLSLATSTTKRESKYIDGSKLQAVFLNGGQVYFGNIQNLNDKYMRMTNIYYLRVNQTVQPNGNTSQNNDVSLVKLGCELHGPQDQMVINRDQVVFWENLKGDGQVAKAVADYVKANPNGQQCNTDSSSSSNSNTNTNTSTTNKKQ